MRLLAPLKVLLVDDHMMFSDGLKSILLLHEHIGQIKICVDAESAYEQIQKEKFDLVITDIRLPGMNGLALTRKIKTYDYRIPVLVLSMYLGRELAKEVLSVEADGYLSKKANKEELFSALDKIVNGGTFYGNEVTSIMADLINEKQFHTRARKKEFTKREREILHLICQECSSKEIADKLCIGVSTVETHRRSMLQKTDSKNVIGLVRFAVQNELALWH